METSGQKVQKQHIRKRSKYEHTSNEVWEVKREGVETG